MTKNKEKEVKAKEVAETTPKKPPREKSEGVQRTEGFKETLQAYFNDEFETKISKEKAWKVFKGLIALIVGNVIKKGRLSLSGVGVFEVQKCGARKSRVGKFLYVPKFRFRPSSKIDDHLMKQFSQEGPHLQHLAWDEKAGEKPSPCLEKGVTLEDALGLNEAEEE